MHDTRRPLGNTDIEVSACCLGTMTWGEQNTEAEAHRQLDRAVDFGINFNSNILFCSYFLNK